MGGNGLVDKKQDLPLAVGPLADSLQRCAIVNQRPSLLRGQNAAVFMFLDRKDEARIFPDDRGVELVSVSSRADGDLSVSRVLLDCVTWALRDTRDPGLNRQIGVSMLDLQRNASSAFWLPAFIILPP